jgi:hypothetical protein
MSRRDLSQPSRSPARTKAGRRAATLSTLIETAGLNDIDP